MKRHDPGALPGLQLNACEAQAELIVKFEPVNVRYLNRPDEKFGRFPVHMVELSIFSWYTELKAFFWRNNDEAERFNHRCTCATYMFDRVYK